MMIAGFNNPIRVDNNESAHICVDPDSDDIGCWRAGCRARPAASRGSLLLLQLQLKLLLLVQAVRRRTQRRRFTLAGQILLDWVDAHAQRKRSTFLRAASRFLFLNLLESNIHHINILNILNLLSTLNIHTMYFSKKK